MDSGRSLAASFLAFSFRAEASEDSEWCFTALEFVWRLVDENLNQSCFRN